MTGKLYVVGTPIGNLSDFSPRAAECLRLSLIHICKKTSPSATEKI